MCHVSLCPFATLTGLPCPGCGLLRAGLAAARGHLAEAFAIHPLVFVVVPTVAFAALRLSPGAAPSRRGDALLVALVLSVVVALGGVWVLRFGGALGGPAAVNSIWSATGRPSPFAAWVGTGATLRR